MQCASRLEGHQAIRAAVAVASRVRALVSVSFLVRIPESLNSRSPVALVQKVQSVFIETSPLLPYGSSITDKLVPPIRSSFRHFSVYIHPPSPFLEPLRDLLQSYRIHYPALSKILPFLNLWLRSHGITPDEISESCLALMVIAYLQVELGMQDIQRLLEVKATGPHGVHWIERRSDPKSKAAVASLWCDLRVSTKAVTARSLETTSMGQVLHGFFRSARSPYRCHESLTHSGQILGGRHPTGACYCVHQTPSLAGSSRCKE